MESNKSNYITKQSLQFKVLSEGQCRQICDAAFRVLERTGCRVYHDGAKKLLLDAGCRDEDDRIKIPSYLIEKAIRTAPSQITIYNREGAPALHLGARSGNSYFVAGLENQHVVDSDTGEKRLTTKKDVARTGLVIEALPNIDVACGLGCISDCAPNMEAVHEIRILLEHTTKPILMWNFDRKNVETQVELCATIAGGLKNLQSKPFIIAGAAATTPLSHSEDALDKLLYMFELGLPTPYVASTMLGGTAPVTLAGSFVMGLADTLVGLLLSQLINPGCPFIGTIFTDAIDMMTMAFAHTSPELTLGQAASADIFRLLDLPFAVHLGCTDSPILDQQAAFDIGNQLFMGMLSGANLNFFIGYLETAMSSSLECLVYGDEVIGHLRHIIRGVEVSAETLAEDVIHTVGPGGNFLAEEHTLNHFKKAWMPGNFVRKSYENWVADGKKDFNARATDKVNDIVAKGPVKPLDSAVLGEMDSIVKKAEENR